MPPAPPERLLLAITGVVQEINQLGRQFDGIGEIVPQSSVTPPKRFRPAELAFHKAVSWLYASCFETGKIGVRFLLEFYCKAYPHEAAPAKGELEAIQNLRTLLQHHLDINSAKDLGIDRNCGDWFANACGTAVPNTEGNWKKCLTRLLCEAQELFQRLVVALRDIEVHPARAQLLATWRFRKLRYRAPHEFDVAIQTAAADLGRESLDIEKFRERNYDKWSQALALVREDLDVEREVRRMVEYSLLAEELRVLPVTGADVMEALQIAPGPLVGEMLKRAKTIYESAPCSKEVLLGKLIALKNAEIASSENGSSNPVSAE